MHDAVGHVVLDQAGRHGVVEQCAVDFADPVVPELKPEARGALLGLAQRHQARCDRIQAV